MCTCSWAATLTSMVQGHTGSPAQPRQSPAGNTSKPDGAEGDVVGSDNLLCSHKRRQLPCLQHSWHKPGCSSQSRRHKQGPKAAWQGGLPRWRRSCPVLSALCRQVGPQQCPQQVVCRRQCAPLCAQEQQVESLKRVTVPGSTGRAVLSDAVKTQPHLSPRKALAPQYNMGASSFSPSPITTTPSMEMSFSTLRIMSTAAWSAAFLSPLPSLQQVRCW